MQNLFAAKELVQNRNAVGGELTCQTAGLTEHRFFLLFDVDRSQLYVDRSSTLQELGTKEHSSNHGGKGQTGAVVVRSDDRRNSRLGHGENGRQALSVQL